MNEWIERAGQGWAGLVDRLWTLVGVKAEPGWLAAAGLLLCGLALLLLALVLVRRRRQAQATPEAPGSLWARSRAEATVQADGAAQTAAHAAVVVAGLLAALRSGAGPGGSLERASRLEEEGGHLRRAVVMLAGLCRGRFRSSREIEPALVALQSGNTAPACQVLEAMVDTAANRAAEQDPLATATLCRHLAALSFIEQPDSALEPAAGATVLAPDQAEGWSLLGLVAIQVGDLERAREASEKLLTLCKGTGDRTLIAGALGVLGEVYHARGGLDRAEEYYRIALTYQVGLDRPESMVRHYRSLGEIYQARGDWGRAADIVSRALVLERDRDHREGMAELERQAGIIADRCGNLADACGHWARARQLYRELGRHDMAAEAEALMTAAIQGGGVPRG